MNYSSLKQHIADQMGRSDLDSQIPLFIEMAEASINRRIRVRDMACPATVDVSGKYINLPVDYLAVRSLRVKDGLQMKPVSPEVLQNKKAANCKGPPSWFVELGKRIEIYPEADETVFEVVFYERIQPLSDAHPSNWLLSQHPDAYVTGAMSQYALLYVRNNEYFPDWLGMHDAIINQIQTEDRLDRWSGNSMSVNNV